MALGRQIALCLSTLTAAVLLLGCGGDDSTNAKIDPAVAASINEKLTQIQDRADAGDCTGENSAQTSLASLQEAVSGDLLAGEDEGFRSDLSDLLNQLGDQLDSQCEEATTTESTSTTSSTTDSSATETTTSTTTSSTKPETTKPETTEPETTEPETTEPPPTDNPGNGNGPPEAPPGQQPGGPSGGVGPAGGFSPGEKKPKDEEKPKHHGKPEKPPKDEK